MSLVPAVMLRHRVEDHLIQRPRLLNVSSPLPEHALQLVELARDQGEMFLPCRRRVFHDGQEGVVPGSAVSSQDVVDGAHGLQTKGGMEGDIAAEALEELVDQRDSFSRSCVVLEDALEQPANYVQRSLYCLLLLLLLSSLRENLVQVLQGQVEGLLVRDLLIDRSRILSDQQVHVARKLQCWIEEARLVGWKMQEIRHD
mmetsp:Transcript_31740/g.101325  ORF Transcript_31740/g.101325 Transcript_31740/m.101325 type:complete len:200 (-) Transcript_31740:6-605(-)